jgi:hypothetical protein
MTVALCFDVMYDCHPYPFPFTQFPAERVAITVKRHFYSTILMITLFTLIQW